MLPSQRIELKTKEIQTRNAAAAIGKKSKKCNAAASVKLYKLAQTNGSPPGQQGESTNKFDLMGCPEESRKGLLSLIFFKQAIFYSFVEQQHIYIILLTPDSPYWSGGHFIV